MTHMDRATRVAVIGAGLGGLTVAAYLQRAGFAVTVYEQTDSFERIGAGIILGANAVAPLARLGLLPGLIAAGIRPDAFVSRAWDTGATTYELVLDAAAEARFGGPLLNIHRADLHVVLQSALRPGSIVFGHRLVGLDETSHTVKLRFDNAATAEADIAIGADGIWSRVRDILLGAEPPRFTGRVAQRAIFPTRWIPGPSIRDCTKWWGVDRHILAYFMTGRRDEVYLMASVPAASWNSEQSSLPCDRDEFIAGFAHFHPDLRRAVEAAVEVTVWPIYDREQNDRWADGRIVLLGDACHPVRPYMAAGGSMAIEDAAILSRSLAACGDPSAAFRQYQAVRIPRVAEVQRISIENSWMRGPTDTDWFFRYDATTVAVGFPETASR
jgi:6-hydroxynicotinate 3-monooxygenase